MRSNKIIDAYKNKFAEICNLPGNSDKDRIEFLRKYLSVLNEFLFEVRPSPEIDELNNPDENHHDWKRLTPFLAIWDDYAQNVLGFNYDQTQIEKLAKVVVSIFSSNPSLQADPKLLHPDEKYSSLGGMTPRQFATIRLMHASQDFSMRLPEIDEQLVTKIRSHFESNDIPDEVTLTQEPQAIKLLAAFGGADNNMAERIRYICDIANVLHSQKMTAYDLATHWEFDAKFIFKFLTILPGIKSKKANMIVRDFYEMGIWQIRRNLQDINIITDNRVMRVALRTGIIRTEMGKLLNSSLDQFDFQYGLCIEATEEAFKRVWIATKQFNQGQFVVSYPARLDAFIFKLADGRSGCCKKNARACKNNRMPPAVRSWLLNSLHYETELACPFQDVCPEDSRHFIAPFAIQNNTWVGEIFTGPGGGGGLSGI